MCKREWSVSVERAFSQDLGSEIFLCIIVGKRVRGV